MAGCQSGDEGIWKGLKRVKDPNRPIVGAAAVIVAATEQNQLHVAQRKRLLPPLSGGTVKKLAGKLGLDCFTASNRLTVAFEGIRRA